MNINKTSSTPTYNNANNVASSSSNQTTSNSQSTPIDSRTRSGNRVNSVAQNVVNSSATQRVSSVGSSFSHSMPMPGFIGVIYTQQPGSENKPSVYLGSYSLNVSTREDPLRAFAHLFTRDGSGSSRDIIQLEAPRLSENALEIITGLDEIFGSLRKNSKNYCPELLEKLQELLGRVHKEDPDSIHCIVSLLHSFMASVHEPVSSYRERWSFQSTWADLKMHQETTKSLQSIMDSFCERLMSDDFEDDKMICLMLRLSPMSLRKACSFYRENGLLVQVASERDIRAIQYADKELLEKEPQLLKECLYVAYDEVAKALSEGMSLDEDLAAVFRLNLDNISKLLVKNCEVVDKKEIFGNQSGLADDIRFILGIVNLISHKSTNDENAISIVEAFRSFISEMGKERDQFLNFITNFGEALQYADDTLKNDKEIVRAALKNNVFAFKHASKELQADHELISEVLNINSLFSSCIENPSDKQGVIQAIHRGFEIMIPNIHEWANVEQRLSNGEIDQQEFDTQKRRLLTTLIKTYNDLKLILLGLCKSGYLCDIEFATQIIDQLTDSLKKCKTYIRELGDTQGSAKACWQNALKSFEKVYLPILMGGLRGNSNKEIVPLLVSRYGRAYLYIVDSLKRDEEIALHAAIEDEDAVLSFDHSLLLNHEFVSRVIFQNPATYANFLARVKQAMGSSIFPPDTLVQFKKKYGTIVRSQ